jgi:hypothetical protein
VFTCLRYWRRRERRKVERINEKCSYTVMRGGGGGRRILHSWSTGSKAKQVT